jgi:hypothetical protein
MYGVLRVAVVLTTLAGSGLGQTCGVERWSVKTGTDSDCSASTISLD